jgi:hypothetical protein
MLRPIHLQKDDGQSQGKDQRRHIDQIEIECIEWMDIYNGVVGRMKISVKPPKMD